MAILKTQTECLVETKNKKENLKHPFFTLTIIPSMHCNLRCRMCFNWKAEKSTIVSAEEWENLIESLGSKNILGSGGNIEISIGGGEPFLNPSVFSMMRISRKKGFRCSISTNGTLLTIPIIKKSIEMGLSGISISLDSLDPDVHDYYRGVKGTHKRVMQAIDFIAENTRLDLCINTVMMKGNLDEIIYLSKWIEYKKNISHNIQIVVEPFNVVRQPKWYKKKEFVHLWPDDQNKINQVIDKLIELKEEKFGNKMVNSVSQLEIFRKYFEMPEQFIKHYGCNLVEKDSFLAMPDGSIYLCTLMDPIGNIKEQSFDDILNSVRLFKTVDMMNKCKKNCHFLINCDYKDEHGEID